MIARYVRLAVLNLQVVPLVQWVPVDQDSRGYPCRLVDLVDRHDRVCQVSPGPQEASNGGHLSQVSPKDAVFTSHTGGSTECLHVLLRDLSVQVVQALQWVRGDHVHQLTPAVRQDQLLREGHVVRAVLEYHVGLALPGQRR